MTMPAGIKSYKDLIVWQQAMDLAVRSLCRYPLLAEGRVVRFDKPGA